jgi:hypothetical protein
MDSYRKNLRSLLRLSLRSTGVAAIALLGLAALPGTGRAIDLTPDTTRYLSDPSFLPLAGQILSETTYTHTDHSEDFQPSHFVGQNHFSANIDTGTQYFSYGITDRLSVNASGSYEGQSGHYSDGAATTRDEFNNPRFGLTYRALDQAASPVSIDLSAFYSPSAVTGQSQQGGGTVAVSRETRFVTIQASVGASYIDQYSSDTSAFTPHSGYWNYNAGLRSQIRVTDRFAVNSGVAFSKNSDITYEGGYFRDNADGTWTPNLALNYAIVPGQVDVAFEYDHSFLGDDHRSSPSYYGPNGVWTNDDQNLYAVHLRVLF